ncbi:hypothetical protein BKG91_00140 [Rodentibacter caecimuris]|uniref:Uncharacterized protein n=1 Tax=Rodentibacter caecimuris TaxID=1796644 RepID=A0A9X8VY31_9PAST|nr:MULTISPECIES: hypothetical protein [Pasteurellaceae]AOF52579.1 hypothetical protein AC062_0483 [Pasteurellaceae bacterium NI1060]MCR1837005.1 hypothetical protein [Pasteurella caecimuris]MCU0107011.1 hypothetical protein [Pasteurella caecimuris]OOF70640.1 hypothetical protein BKG90_09545 [Rodentibacter heylii]OOF76568.1 hypothetical protein BKG91_00140 [Rodentibacter heylii]
MNIDINNLNETEVTALTARIRQLNGEDVSPIPYLMACIAELAEVFKTMPETQREQLTKTRNELLFLRLHFTELKDETIKARLSKKPLSDEGLVKVGLMIAAAESILDILATLQNAADIRLMTISKNGLEIMGAYNGTIN